jgi:hypothetical protein
MAARARNGNVDDLAGPQPAMTMREWLRAIA